MNGVNRFGTVVLFAALSFTACKPEPSGTPCTAPSDCGASTEACVENTCIDQICGTANRAAGTRVGTQTTGDCKVTQCDGDGRTTTANDDTDVPVDSQDCTDDVCTAGVPSNPARAAASTCGAGGLLKCDGQGSCVTCIAPTDCGSSTECQARTCVAGVCGVNNVASGTAVASQTAGDCKVTQCDGNGATQTVNDDADVLADTTTCTTNICTAGVPSNPPIAAGTACSEGTGTLCNGTGACVACVTANDCAGTDSECQQRTCTAGVCGIAFTPVNTAVASQTAHDCKQSVCDGAGAISIATDNTDLPNDNNTCTADSCVAGAPTFANTTGSCGTAGVCSNGTCVGCNQPSDCPGTNDECKTRTCVANVCGFTFTPANTAVASQVANDCKTNACDGIGNIVNQNDDGDLPVDDGRQCTSQVCNSGVPSFPNAAVNTACTENSGSFCSSAGACVQCTQPSQCTGNENECSTRTCNGNTCGVALAPNGFVTAAQTANDCQENRCNGAGVIVAVAQNTDLPPDDGNQCTDQACSAGTPAFPASAANTACGPGGGSFCNGTGTCVTCTQASQCPGSVTECQNPTCNANACGTAYTAAGTTTASQTANNCQSNQCDGLGNIVSAADNADAPLDDGNQCTSQSCVAGVPTFSALAANTACNQNGGSFCSSAGSCVACNLATQCPSTGNECRLRTCSGNTCGTTLAPSGTPLLVGQTQGDCQQLECTALGSITSVEKNSDTPTDDGNQCTAEFCNSGLPTFTFVPTDTACNQNSGSFCNSTGDCVSCNSPTQCPGTVTECQARTCTGNACGIAYAPAGLVTSAQTIGDCKVNQCDGNGNIVSAGSSVDVPADDGNQCTDDVCSAGVPAHTAKPADTACNQNGGSYCSGTGACVVCNVFTQCPGADTECSLRTCAGNTCGTNNAPAGTALASQTSGDCSKAECDGDGSIVSAADNADLPADDGNQCTAQVCSAGTPAYSLVAFGVACNQSGGSICDGSGACVTPPQVGSTDPADGSTPLASTPISVAFTSVMNAATITGQTTAGACSGSIQVSLNNFASCIAFSSAAAAMTNGGAVATFTPAPGLLVNRGYKIRVTTAVMSSSGVPLAAQFTQSTGFTTTSPNLCGGSLVISQVYGGGGLSGATYKNDFVELHNRGSTTINLTGRSIQYASSSGTTWTKMDLSGQIPAGGYFLIQLFAGAAGAGAALPTADQSLTTLDIAGANGKLALMNSTTQIPSTVSCPSALDFVGYGTANCFEGTAAVTAPSSTLSARRVQAGCGDVNNNNADFTTAVPAPRNSATAASECSCTVRNESGTSLETDYCTVQFPLPLSTAAGATTALVYGRVYELGMTDVAGAPANVRAQLGWGPASANPQYEAGWSWTNATYNSGFVDPNTDEYQASFTAPAVGIYRYVYRFSLDQGVTWTVCDANAEDAGAGSNPTLTFELSTVPVLTVTP